MVEKKTISMLVSLLTGRTNVKEFEQQLADELFHLRQDPSVTDEKNILSKMQLYLHELQEGNRDIIEIYMAAQSALDLARPPNRPIKSGIDTYIPSTAGSVVPTTSEPQPIYVKFDQPLTV